MKKKALSLLLASAMVLGLAACGDNNGDASNESGSQSSGSSSTDESTPDASGSDVDVNANWDGAYIDGDDYRAYISHDLELLVADMEEQLTSDQKTAVDAAKTAGLEAIAKAGTVSEVRKAYSDAYDAILACVPLANGLISHTSVDYDVRTDMLGILETYAVRNGITGMSLYETAGFQMYNDRVTLGTENYIVGYGFGTLAEGSITADLEYETNPDWKRYYHTLSMSDPGTLNYLNSQGEDVSDQYSYIAAGFFNTFMNDTKDGYEWVPELAMEMPVAMNDDDGDGAASKWRFQVRTGAEGLKYTTGSKIASRAAFNNREVALEDYETPFKLLLTQSNQLYRGSEMANNTTGAIVGAKAYYDATANGYNDTLWKNVGIRTYVEDGKSYFEVEFTQDLSRFYAMYYITSSLYMPVPQDFLDLVTVQNYLGFNNDATETPVDNSLSLGSYYLEAYNQDQEVVYKKNPNYVFADTKFSIEGVHVRIFPAISSDKEASINEFLAGHTDATGIPDTKLDEYRNDPRTRRTTSGSVFKLNINALNLEDWETLFGEDGSVTQTAKEDYWEVEPALGNRHFVLAMQHSIDRKTSANSRGYYPVVNYFTSAYMADPENGVPYNNTDAHAKAIASLLEDTDEAGYSLELAREYFRIALTELENDGVYTPGTAENPTMIHLEIAWMSEAQDTLHNEIASYIETAFNDPSVSDGKYQISVDFWVGNDQMDVYYVKAMVGQYDMSYGGINGNTLNPLDFMSVLSSDQSISGGFTLNWGTNTNDPDAYPIVYKGERYSYDAFYTAANLQAIVADGANGTAVTVAYENIVKNEDGSYTGAVEFKAALPDLTTVTPTKIACCNYERYRNGDETYDETYLENFTVEDKGDGVVRVTFTVPAELAADYATGSGTSANPQGMTGFDFYYDYTLDGTANIDNYYSVEDFFAVE